VNRNRSTLNAGEFIVEVRSLSRASWSEGKLTDAHSNKIV
jgi:hypothetical protein